MRWNKNIDVDVVQNVHEYTWKMHLQCMISFKAGSYTDGLEFVSDMEECAKVYASRVHAVDRRSLDG
ncbi:hypothetical protein ACI2OX_07795 [Bacillus sp. N9]